MALLWRSSCFICCGSADARVRRLKGPFMSRTENFSTSAAVKFSALWGSREPSAAKDAALAFLQRTHAGGKPTVMPLRGFATFALVLLLALPLFAAGKSDKVAPDFSQFGGGDKVDVIVQFTLPPTAADIASV